MLLLLLLVVVVVVLVAIETNSFQDNSSNWKKKGKHSGTLYWYVTDKQYDFKDIETRNRTIDSKLFDDYFDPTTEYVK
ncbi:hypothetical protein RDWZM_010157 [Blomia tropicalis]|uniref:Uncharacterized protein n=1 Tax=Blomia tropicalis TaxID=40697 RepID=A0A9Q0M1G7_BLOTA|nr:hypothetical protein RDWZM_010157 [Blomia tropicalis]